MNVQSNLIWKLILYKFKMHQNAAEATKNICCTKGDITVDQLGYEILLRFQELHWSDKVRLT